MVDSYNGLSNIKDLTIESQDNMNEFQTILYQVKQVRHKIVYVWFHSWNSRNGKTIVTEKKSGDRKLTIGT